MASISAYELGLVSYDCSTPSTLDDLFYALDHLQNTLDDVFNRIEKRVKIEKKRIKRMENRMKICDAKIDGIAKAKSKATTIFSTSKYPTKINSKNPLEIYHTLFRNKFANPEDTYAEPDENKIYSLPNAYESKRLANQRIEIYDDLNLLFSKINPSGTDIDRVELIMEDDGLGTMPSSINTVSSVVLFNSNVMPYHNYSTWDNLLGITNNKLRAESTNDERALALAPTTLIDGDNLPSIETEDINYKPQEADMISFDLPSNLPLPDVADIHFAGQIGNNDNNNNVALLSIAPSAFNSLEGLPDLQNDGILDFNSLPTFTSNVPPPAPVGIDTSNTSPPPPPPDPINNNNNNAPPPPPPNPMMDNNNNTPPPPIITDNTTPQEAPKSAPKNIPEDIKKDTKRVSLMDAIRGVDLGALKKKEENKIGQKKEKQQQNDKPLSMFEEIKLKMKRRQNAISGKKDRVQQKMESKLLSKDPNAFRQSSMNVLQDENMRLSLIDELDSDESEESDDSDFDQSTFDTPKLATTKSLPVKKMDIRKNQQKERASMMGPKPPLERRGSLFDKGNQNINRMLLAIGDDEEDDDDDEWDD